MFKENYIEDSLDSIKNILYYSFDTIDYTPYISDLERIICVIEEEQKDCVDEEKLNRLVSLNGRAQDYLAKIKTFQKHFDAKQKEDEEMGIN